MTKWFFFLFFSLFLIISFRLLTFSPIPQTSLSCNELSVDSKLSGLWNLNRIDNFSGFEPLLIERGIEKYSFLINTFYPFLLESSQVLNIDICGDEISLFFNNLRIWNNYSFTIIDGQIKSNISDLVGTGSYLPNKIFIKINSINLDFNEEIYLDGGELVREINFLNSSTGKIKFIYRKND